MNLYPEKIVLNGEEMEVVEVQGRIVTLKGKTGIMAVVGIHQIDPDFNRCGKRIIVLQNPEEDVRRLFADLAKREAWPATGELLIKATFGKNLTTHYILNLLNSFGYFGLGGVINIQYEWRFRLPTKNDAGAAKMIEGDDSLLGFQMHDFGAKGSEEYWRSMKGLKIDYFIGRLTNLTKLYKES